MNVGAAIVCLEGPSAVGKTSLASALAERGAVAIPEVNQLYSRPAPCPAQWYLERQADRWQAAAHASVRSMAVLDGDPFQPLWYNWIYPGLEPLDALVAFYRPRMASAAMRFPQRYIVLQAPVETLRAHKESDATRKRGNFDKHLRLVEPQRRYFEAMKALAPRRVEFTAAQDIEAIARAIVAAPAALGGEDDLVLFDGIVRWLRANTP